MIIERQRGGERNDYDVPALTDGAFVDITDMVVQGFDKALTQGLGNSVSESFVDRVPEDSKFFPLDRKIPQYLYPDLSEFVRSGCASTDLRNFISQIITVQAKNVVTQALTSGHTAIEFHPADLVTYANTTARPIYAFLRRHRDEFKIETETSFRLFTPEPKVEAISAAE